MFLRIACSVAFTLLVSLCITNQVNSLPATLTSTPVKIGTGAVTTGLVALWLKTYIALKKAAEVYKQDPQSNIKKESYITLKKRFRRLSILTPITGTANTALLLNDHPVQPLILEQAHNATELKKILSHMTYEELTTLLRSRPGSGQLTTQVNTSYVEKLTLKDSSVWFLKVARRPGQVNRHGTFEYRFGLRQNRSRYDQAQKINNLGIKLIHAPKKILAPLKGAGPDQDAWTDKECVVLSPALPAGSIMASPSIKKGDLKERDRFIVQLREYVTKKPEAIEALAQMIQASDFADGHFGNIAILPGDEGLMIYNTEDILSGVAEKEPELAQKLRKSWGVNNFIGRSLEQPGVSALGLSEENQAQKTLRRIEALKRQFD